MPTHKPTKKKAEPMVAFIEFLSDFGGKGLVGAHPGPSPNYVARVVRPFFKEQAWAPLNAHYPFPVYGCGVGKSHAMWLMNPNPKAMVAEV